MTSEAKEKDFTVYKAIFGEIILNEKKAIKQSSGAVYGIFAESETPLRTGIKPIKGHPKFYPVYWGKDIAPVSRLKAHVQNHKSTGNADLRGIKEIENKKLIFGAILVSDYQKFEKHLHEAYPPLKGTNRTGRLSQIIEILN
ncbi:MAG: hypothetical protein HRT92_03195 [Piscirickettsiaceae bacterium]|nr:hypothetical protein [Piscirickettsiaceae bacterium]